MGATGFLFAFAATACWAIAAFPLTTASRLLPVSSMNHLRLLLSVVLLLIGGICIDPQAMLLLISPDSLTGWCWLGLSGIMALVVGDFFSFRSYAILSPQKGSVLTTLSPASALLLGMLLVNEQINWVGIIGMVITITGVMSISLGRSQRNAIPDHGHGSVTKGILYGILAAICHGGALALSKKGFNMQAAEAHPLNWAAATFMRVFAAFVTVYLVTLVRGQWKEVWLHLRESKAGINYTIAGSLFNPVFSVSLSMITILYINVAVAQTIFAMVPLFALVIAFVVYREKITLRSLLGVLIALVGVTLLIWRTKIALLLGA